MQIYILLHKVWNFFYWWYIWCFVLILDIKYRRTEEEMVSWVGSIVFNPDTKILVLIATIKMCVYKQINIKMCYIEEYFSGKCQKRIKNSIYNISVIFEW
jgi:hypothetical protein